MLASASETLPLGNAWTYEIKWDGYRALAVKDGTSIRLISRNEKNLTNDYPAVVSAFKEALGVRAYLRTVIDDLGEALGEDQQEHVANHRH